MSRALGHVSNSLSFQRFGHQMVAQSAAGIMWPGAQGASNGDYQIKFLADRIVKAPFWHAQRMLSTSHQPNVVGGYHTAVNATCTRAGAGGAGAGGPGCGIGVPGPWSDWMAAVSDDGKVLVVRTENPNSVGVQLTATIKGGPWQTAVAMQTLSADSLGATNDYDKPDAVAPKNSTATLAGPGGNLLRVVLPPYSFCVLTLRAQ